LRLDAGPAPPVHAAPDMVPARLPRRYASRIYKHLDAVRAAAAWHRADEVEREASLAAGGRGAGALWMQLPDRPSDLLGTAHFRVATLLRIGALKPPRTATCQLEARGTRQRGEEGGGAAPVCGRAMGRWCEHALLCKCGPARLRPHRALAGVLARELRDCGAEVDLERVVPDLSDLAADDPEKRDAVLDIVASFPGSFAFNYVDVSIRCPHASRYTRAAHVPGSAAAKAADEKRDRYGPSVLPLVFESYGRLGTDGRRTLETLALHASATLRDQWAVQRLVPRWHASLERAVTFATAEIVLLALGSRAQNLFARKCEFSEA